MTWKRLHVLQLLVAFCAGAVGVQAAAQQAPPIRLAGHIHYDLTRFSEAPSPLQDASVFRRFRLALAFGEAGHTQGKFQYDFANDRWIDAYVRRPIAGGEMTAGQFRPAFSADILLSSAQAFFTENATANAFSPGRRLGVQYAKPGWALGLYGRDAHDVGPEYAAAARGYVSRSSTLGLLHLGASATFEHPQPGNSRISLRPEVGSDSGSWLSSPRYTADSSQRGGLEAAVQNDKWLLHAEWFQHHFDAKTLSARSAHGGFVTAAWTIYGAPRVYKNGLFGTPAPVTGSLGSIELALRYATISLPTNSLAPATQRSVSIGLNVQISEQWRLQMDRHQSRRAGDAGFAQPHAGAWTLRIQWVY